ncbi:MAG: M13 family metallopeptidase, partial [Cellulomonas sp.]|nr:M13 family metallopeptidase [Cellulomonas sp.]
MSYRIHLRSTDSLAVVTAFDLDPTIRPQDDLYRHVNGRWLNAASIPDDQPATGAFVQLRDAAEAAIRDIVTGLSGSEPGSEAAKVEHLYASFMDAERVDYLGLEPLAPILAEIDTVSSLEELLAYFARSLRRGTGAPFELDVDSDPGDPSRYVLFLGQGGIGLPDEEYYRLGQHASILESYRDHVDRTAAMAGIAAGGLPGVVELETEVAALHWDKVRNRDLVAMYNPISLPDLDATGLGWSSIL